MRPEQRHPPQRVRPEDVLGLKPEHEALQLVDAVERRHRPGEGAGRGAVDPADARPQVASAQALEEPELDEDAVDGPAGEDDRDVSLHSCVLYDAEPASTTA